MPAYIHRGYRRKLDLTKVIALYEAGYSFRKIATIFHVTHQAVHAALIKAGVHAPNTKGSTIWEPLTETEINALYREKDAEIVARAKERARKDSLMLSANNKVARAIARGLLKVAACEVCGFLPVGPNARKKIHAHHDDYHFPLSVRWLCEKHHKQWHVHHDPVYPQPKE